MSTKMLAISDHEAFLALDFLSRFGAEKADLAEPRDKLEDVATDKQKLALELNEDEPRLLVEGYEDQAATLWVAGVDVGERLRKDERPRFTDEQTELYRKMKKTVQEAAGQERKGR